jgi:large subunit ribosomal protein L17
MRHKVDKLGLNINSNRKALLIGNLATSLILHEKIKTTETKAKALQGVMDKLIETAKKSAKKDAIRSLGSILHNELSSKKLIEDLAKRYQERQSGYTRITRLGFRAGDAASMVQIELI